MYSFGETWDTQKRLNVSVTAIQERFKNARRLESIFKEVMSENFPNLAENVV